MKKQIIFFDADGTIWYPKKIKYTKHPIWLYNDKRYRHYTSHIIMTPSALSTIKKLKSLGIITIALSTHPHPPKKANIMFKHKKNISS